MLYQTYLMRSVPIFAILLTLSITAAADAAFISSISGNTNPGLYTPLPGIDGTVNFAILTNDGPIATAAGDTFGTGDLGFNARFLPGADVTDPDFPVTSPAFDVLA